MQRRLLLPVIALAAISLAAASASAFGETTETTTEAPPASTGWVPQGGASEGSGSGSSGAQQGSSLGSGSSPSKPAPQPTPPPSEPVATAPPPAPEPSTSYEDEAPVESAAPEPVATPASDPEPAPPKPDPKPSPPVDAHVALSGADAVLEGSGDVKGVSASSADAAPATAQVTAEPGGLPWLALIVFGLILVVAGMRLVLGPFEADSLRYSRFRFLRRAAPRP